MLDDNTRSRLDIYVHSAIGDALADEKQASDKTTALNQVAALDYVSRETERSIAKAVDQARAHGATWADIGKALGVTRQASHTRYAQH